MFRFRKELPRYIQASHLVKNENALPAGIKRLKSEEYKAPYTGIRRWIFREMKITRNQALGERLGLILLGLDLIREFMRGDEKIFFAHYQAGGIEAGKLEAVAMRDSVGRAGLNTIATEDAAVVVDVVDLGIALRGGDTILGCIVCGLDVDAVRGAGGGTKETGNTFFKAVLVTLELVLAAKTLLKDSPAHGTFAVRIVLDFGRLEDLLEGDAHSLGNGCGGADFRHGLSITCAGKTEEAGLSTG
jgi:hypothetical protein